MAAAASRCAAQPRLVPRDAADGAHHVNLHGFDAHLQNSSGVDHGCRIQFRSGKAERTNCGEYTFRVLDRRPHEEMDVPGEPWRAVERKRVGANDEKFSALRDQRADELVEVWRQVHETVSGGIRRPRHALPAGGTASIEARADRGAPPRTRSSE